MPVVLHDHIPDPDLEPGTQRSDIVVLLYSNTDLGFAVDDVSEELSIESGNARVTLESLYEQNYVGRTADGHYYALERREDLRRYTASVEQTERMFSRSIYLSEQEGEYRTEMSDEEAAEELAVLENDLE